MEKGATDCNKQLVLFPQCFPRHVKLYTTTVLNINEPEEIKKKLLKTLWEKEKMLNTSIFSFSNNVSYLVKDRNNHLCQPYITVLARKRYFLLFQQCFLPIQRQKSSLELAVYKCVGWKPVFSPFPTIFTPEAEIIT